MDSGWACGMDVRLRARVMRFQSIRFAAIRRSTGRIGSGVRGGRKSKQIGHSKFVVPGATENSKPENSGADAIICCMTVAVSCHGVGRLESGFSVPVQVQHAGSVSIS